MNILFITPQIPYPPHSGGRIVTWNTIKRFAQHHQVSVVCLYHHPSELDALETMNEVCDEVAAFPAYGKWSLYPLVRCLFSAQPYKAHRFYNHQMAGYIARLIERKNIEIVHAQNFYTTKYVNPKWELLKIHYKENVEGNILLHYARTSANPVKKLLFSLEGYRTRQFELNACRKFDQVFSISPLDCDVLNRLDSSLNVLHQRSGVDLQAYPFLDEAGDDPVVVFTGTLSYYPNADGVLYFLERCWGAIRDEFPNAQFWIASLP